MIEFESVDFGRILLAVLLHFVWQATLIASILFLFKTFIGGRHVRTHYSLLLGGLLATAAAPIATFTYYVSAYDQLPGMVAESSAAFSLEPHSHTDSMTQFSAMTGELFLWFDSCRSLWLGIWLTGALVLFARMIIGFVACQQLRSGTIPLSPRVQQVVSNLKQKMKIGARVSVVATEELSQAIATGILKPIVMIPVSWMTEMPIASLEAVLAHELAHIRRFDLWFVFLQRCVETAFFFHPATWWISRRLTQVREACCDRSAIEVTGNKLQYAKTLAMVAEYETSGGNTLIFSTAFLGDQKMNLLRRITLILEPNCRTPLRPFASVACMTLLIALGSISYNASASTTNTAIADFQDDDQDGDIRVEFVVDEKNEDDNLKARLHKLRKVKDIEPIVAQLVKLGESDDISSDELKAKINALVKRLSDVKKGEQLKKARVTLVEDLKKAKAIGRVRVLDNKKRMHLKAKSRAILETVDGVIHEIELDNPKVMGKLHVHDSDVPLKTKGRAMFRVNDGTLHKVELKELKAGTYELNLDGKKPATRVRLHQHNDGNIHKKGEHKIELHVVVDEDGNITKHSAHNHDKPKMGEHRIRMNVVVDENGNITKHVHGDDKHQGTMRVEARKIHTSGDGHFILDLDTKHEHPHAKHDSDSAHHSHKDVDVIVDKKHSYEIHRVQGGNIVIDLKTDGKHSHEIHRSHGGNHVIELHTDGKHTHSSESDHKGHLHVITDDDKTGNVIRKRIMGHVIKGDNKGDSKVEYRVLDLEGQPSVIEFKDAKKGKFEYRVRGVEGKSSFKGKLHKFEHKPNVVVKGLPKGKAQTRVRFSPKQGKDISTDALSKLRKEVQALRREIQQLKGRAKGKGATSEKRHEAKKKQRVIIRKKSGDKPHDHDDHDHAEQGGHDLTELTLLSNEK